jgi:4-hydroxybenzoate polyprenyltransferase
MNSNQYSVEKKWINLWHLILLSRPEWGFIFSQIALMLCLLYRLPVKSLILGPISIFLFAMAHFGLNGYYDRHSDAINPRGLSLRNPLTSNSRISRKLIQVWVVLLWVFLVPLNLIIMPNGLTPVKASFGFLLLSIGVVGSIMYSVPPFRLKARPYLDILITVFIIGIFIPIYIGMLGVSILVDFELIVLGIVLITLLIAGIHLPTILMDLETDRKVGDVTTAVYLGEKKSIYLTSVVIIARIIALIVLNLYLMAQGILIVSWIPILFGLLEFIAVLNLLNQKDQQSVQLLYKTVVITSGGGAVIFGLLYSPILIDTYSLW